MTRLADRLERPEVLAIAATWLGFCAAAAMAVPQPPEPALVALAALLGAVCVLLGFPAAWRVRPIPPHDSMTRLRFAVLSLVAGGAVGGLLLAVLVYFAKTEPALRARFAGRLGEPLWRPVALGVESSILEEVLFRLFILSTVTWAVGRLIRRPGGRIAVATGVVVSTALFGLAHLPAWSAATHLSLGLVSAVLLLNAAGALLLAWLFWRWGLPYAILAHFAGDVVVQALGPRFMA